MKHNLKQRKLNRTSSHRLALLKNLSISLIKHETITTTTEKAKELRPFILEVNKGPDMKHKDEADRQLKKKVIFDTFNLMNVVKPKTDDYKNMFRKLI